METGNYSNSSDNDLNSTRTIYQLHPHAKGYFYAAMGLQWIIVALILFLNIAVIVTIMRYKKKSRLYFLLMNMAIADLATGITDALVNAIERSFGAPYLAYWFMGGMYFCKFQRWAGSVTLCASNFILAATSIDRALVVALPMMNFRRGYLLQKMIIVMCWLGGAIISGPLLHYNTLVIEPSSFFENSPAIPRCDVNFGAEPLKGWKILYLMMLLFYAVIPLLVIIVSYSFLIFAIYKRARTPPNSVHGIENLNITLVFNRGLPSSKKRSIKLTFGIVLSFVISWSPFFIVYYFSIYHGFNSPAIMPFVTTFYWNSVANPVVFFVFHKRKRTATPVSFYSNDTPPSNKTNGSSTTRSTPLRDMDNTVTIPLAGTTNI